MHFDRLAPFYRSLETAAFGRALVGCRNAGLPWLLAGPPTPPRRVLLLGEGDGRFLHALLAAASGAPLEVDCVDGSAEMLASARRRVRRSINPRTRVRFHHAEARAWLAGRRGEIAAGRETCFDAVTTHFFLDCFPPGELPGLVADIAAVAGPDARWLVGDFRQPAGRGWRAVHARVWLGTMYAFFRLATGLRARRLTDPGPWLAAQGFRCERLTVTRAGLLASAGWRRRRFSTRPEPGS